jgi:hypothetical protein
MTSGEPNLFENLLVGLLFRESAAACLARPQGRRKGPASLIDRQRLIGIVYRLAQLRIVKVVPIRLSGP